MSYDVMKVTSRTDLPQSMIQRQPGQHEECKERALKQRIHKRREATSRDEAQREYWIWEMEKINKLMAKYLETVHIVYRYLLRYLVLV